MDKKKYRIMTHASVFSGIGGAELAASWMGWRNVFHCEINPFARQVLEYWFPKNISYEDITQTSFKEWKGKIDVLTGGFPCQPFSYAGNRKGHQDDRYLWPEMLRTIREVQPSWVIAENVDGIRTMVEPSEVIKMGSTDDIFDKGHILREESKYTLTKICEDFESEGYQVQPILIPACGVGAPHQRNRIWIIANRADSGTENVQQVGQDRFLSVTVTANTKCNNSDKSKETQFQRPSEKGNDSISNKRHTAKVLRKRASHGFRDFERFPTFEPIIRGRNDGLPFNVDNLTISPGKWRSESIKAFGNAWVPQVAFEIFRAIEIERRIRYGN